MQHWAIRGFAYLRKKSAREKLLTYQNLSKNLSKIRFDETNFRINSSSNELLKLDDIYGEIEENKVGISLLEKGICSTSIFSSTFPLCDLPTSPNEYALKLCSIFELNSKSSESTLIKIFKHFSTLIGTATCSITCFKEQQQHKYDKLHRQEILERLKNRRGPAISCEPPDRLSDEVLEFLQTGHLSD